MHLYACTGDNLDRKRVIALLGFGSWIADLSTVYVVDMWSTDSSYPLDMYTAITHCMRCLHACEQDQVALLSLTITI